MIAIMARKRLFIQHLYANESTTFPSEFDLTIATDAIVNIYISIEILFYFQNINCKKPFSLMI